MPFAVVVTVVMILAMISPSSCALGNGSGHDAHVLRLLVSNLLFADKVLVEAGQVVDASGQLSQPQADHRADPFLQLDRNAVGIHFPIIPDYGGFR